MKILTNRQKLDLIDFLCSEKQADSKIGSKISMFVGDIYEIAHPYEGCRHVRWENKWFEIYKILRKEKVI